jgi:hypothetical protein
MVKAEEKMSAAEVAEYLKTLPDDAIRSEHNRRLGQLRSEPVPCPICNERQPSRLALRKHFRSCKTRHPDSKVTLTGVVGEEKKPELGWVAARCFDGSDLAGQQWVAEFPLRRRWRRVQRGSKLWLRAVEAEKKLHGMLSERVQQLLEKEKRHVFTPVR